MDKAVEVADGFWIIAVRHRPGFSKAMPEVNNRCLVFRLTDKITNGPVLVVVNGSDPKVIPEVRRIEKETGLTVKYIVSPGGGHHLTLPAWRDEFTLATVHVCPIRVPKTPSAQKLMAGDRIVVMDLTNPLPQFAGQLDAVIFDGLIGFRDKPTPFEGGKEMNFFSMMKMMMTMDEPVDELWLHHVATDTIIAGENLGWILSPETLKTFPFMMKTMMKPNTVYINDQGRKVGDRAKVAAAWRKILEWPCTTLMGYHERPGEAFVGDGRTALRTAVERSKQLGT